MGKTIQNQGIICVFRSASSGNLSVKEEVEEAKQKNRRKPFHFSMIGLKHGDVITFTSNPEIAAIVADDGKHIIFEGEELSLSQAAERVIKPDYPLQGPVYWKYEGKTLDDMRREKEQLDNVIQEGE